MKKIISITIFIISLYSIITTINALLEIINLSNDFLILNKTFASSKNQLKLLLIFEILILIVSILMFRSALNDEEYESRERYENRKRWQFENAPSTKIVVEKEKKFVGEKDITNDSYKLYLVDKHKIIRNEIFNKYVYKDKMYESIDELLNLLNKEENNNNIEENIALNYEEYLKIRNECIEKITNNGSVVKSLGEYPNTEWSILNTQGFRIKKLKNLQELVSFTNSSK